VLIIKAYTYIKERDMGNK